MIPFADYSERIKRRIETVYGIPVITRDVPDPLLGDLDGAEIQIDYSVTPEQRLFLLGHLFGHTVQWNANPEAYEFGRPRKPPVEADILPQLMEYEREAAGYALQLFHDAGVVDMDQWLSDYTACDMAYLEHFYRTGEKCDFMTLWRKGTAPLPIRTIPPFATTRRVGRSDGIVI